MGSAPAFMLGFALGCAPSVVRLVRHLWHYRLTRLERRAVGVVRRAADVMIPASGPPRA